MDVQTASLALLIVLWVLMVIKAYFIYRLWIIHNGLLHSIDTLILRVDVRLDKLVASMADQIEVIRADAKQANIERREEIKDIRDHQ